MSDKKVTESTEEKYDLYQENIVEKPFAKYRKVFQFLLFTLSAVAFGVIVTLVITYLYPRLNDEGKESSTAIIIQGDTYPSGEPQSTGQNESTGQTESQTVPDIKTAMENSRRSLVQIHIFRENTNPQTAVQQGSNDTFAAFTGLIVAEYEDEFFILTKDSMMREAKRIAVKFNDNSVFYADCIGRYEAADIAMLRVGTSDSQMVSTSLVGACKLGNSYALKSGDEVFMLGRILGNFDAVNYGMCMSNSTIRQMKDVNIKVISTDIHNKIGDDGYIFDRNGKLVGIYAGAEDGHVNAYGISDLKKIFEKLINRQTVPYMGVYGTTVTEEIKMAYELPEGVYVSGVEINSPAFMNGIQIGDVIVKINGDSIRSMEDYTEALLGADTQFPLNVVVKRLGKDSYREITLTINIKNY